MKPIYFDRMMERIFCLNSHINLHKRLKICFFAAKNQIMNKILTLLLISLLTVSAFTQTKKDTNYWTNKLLMGVNGTQTSFVNWSSGGRNNISLLGFLEASAVYQKKNIKWNNEFKFALGGLQFIDSVGKKEGLQKTDDRIDLSTTLGLEIKKKWFYTATGGFKTQSLDGYVYPDLTNRTSTFLAPGYGNFALGIEYADSTIFNVFLSPIATKITIVNDQVLSNAGSFGVKGATYNSLGEVITSGKRVRYEVGAYFRMRFQKEIFKNIELKSRLELFSNYVDNPQNIDVNAEAIFTFKVNKWFSASLQWNVLYDDDINVRDNKGNTGPRTQFKSVLGLGFSHTIKSK